MPFSCSVLSIIFNAVSLLGQTQPEKLFSNPLETSLGDLNIQISQSKNGITLSTRI